MHPWITLNSLSIQGMMTVLNMFSLQNSSMRCNLRHKMYESDLAESFQLWEEEGFFIQENC